MNILIFSQKTLFFAEYKTSDHNILKENWTGINRRQLLIFIIDTILKATLINSMFT